LRKERNQSEEFFMAKVKATCVGLVLSMAAYAAGPGDVSLKWDKAFAGSRVVCGEDTKVKTAADQLNKEAQVDAQRIEEGLKANYSGVALMDANTHTFNRPKVTFELSHTTMSFSESSARQWAVCAVATFTSSTPRGDAAR
jgi:hypothetical protein